MTTSRNASDIIALSGDEAGKKSINIWNDDAAMGILREATEKLKFLGIHVILAPSCLIDGDTSVALHASLSKQAVIDSHCQLLMAGDLADGECKERFIAVRDYYLSNEELYDRIANLENPSEEEISKLYAESMEKLRSKLVSSSSSI